MARTRPLARIAALALLLTALAACSATFRNHGYMPPAEELSGIIVGVDTRASVEDIAGSPGASGAVDGGAYYYVRSRVRSFAFLERQVVEREVLAISFDEAGVIRNIETFGLQDGRVVRLQTRVTESGVSDKTFLRQLIGNLGRIGPNL